MSTCARSESRRSVSATACAVVPPIPASISSKTSVSPPATAAIASATRESSPPDAVSATGPNGSPAFGRIRKTASSAPAGAVVALAQLDTELALAHADATELGGDCRGERLGRSGAGGAQPLGELVDCRLGGGERSRGGLHRVQPVGQRAELRLGRLRASQQLLVRAGPEAPLRVGDSLELLLDLLDAIWIGLERDEEAAQVGSHLVEPQGQIAELVSRARELRRQTLERGDRTLGGACERCRSFAVLGRDRLRRSHCRLDELGEMAQAISFGAKRFLRLRLKAVGRLDERPKLGETRLLRCRVARQLVVPAARRRERAPGHAELPAPALLLLAGIRVEHVELVRGPRQPALLELAGHRKQALGRRGQVFAGDRASPRIRARSSVREDAAREDEAGLVLGRERGESLQLLVVEEAIGQVELRLHVRLSRARPDRGRVALCPEQQPERLGEDRLPRPGLARDRVQPRRRRKLGRSDQDEILDVEATKQTSCCSG